MSLLFHRT